MNTTRIATLAAVMAGAAVGLAAPAAADLVDGTYEETQEWNSGPKTLTVNITSCGAGCKNLAGAYTTDELQQYHLQGKTWTATDSFHSTFTLDNDSLTGTWESPMFSNPVGLRLVKVG